MSETPSPTYRVAEATKDGMSASVWCGNTCLHTVWSPYAIDANIGARLIAAGLSQRDMNQEADALARGGTP